jgi:hypothetical protein
MLRALTRSFRRLNCNRSFHIRRGAAHRTVGFLQLVRDVLLEPLKETGENSLENARQKSIPWTQTCPIPWGIVSGSHNPRTCTRSAWYNRQP